MNVTLYNQMCRISAVAITKYDVTIALMHIMMEFELFILINIYHKSGVV